MRSGPYRGAFRDAAGCTIAQAGETQVGSVAKWFLKQITHTARSVPQFTTHRRQPASEIPTGALFPQVLYSRRCSIHTGVLFQSCTFGGWGAGGLGGWVLLGPMGLVVPVSAPGAVRPSKEACGGAARAAENHFATLPLKRTCYV